MNQFPINGKYQMARRLAPEEAETLGDTPFKSPNHSDVVYLEPDELDELEQPLLLHPYGHDEDDPRRHLRFGDQGIEAAGEIDGTPSAKGKATIEVCQLHEDKLRRRRHAVQKTAWKEFLNQLAARPGAPSNFAQTIEQVWETEDLAEIKAGRSPYSAAALDYVDLWRKALFPGG